MSLYPDNIPRCEHVKINGTQCGSPALKRNHFCYFHKRWQETRIVLNANRARRGRAALDLPVLEDANSIQVSLMQIMRLILSGQMDTKTAGLLLYALQTASSNLSRINFEPAVKTRVVIDPRTVDQTPLGEDPWRREDFEEEEAEEADAREPVAAKAKNEDEDENEDVGRDEEWLAEEIIPEIEAAPSPQRNQHKSLRRFKPWLAPQVIDSNILRQSCARTLSAPLKALAQGTGEFAEGGFIAAVPHPLSELLCLHQSSLFQNRHMMGNRRLR